MSPYVPKKKNKKKSIIVTLVHSIPFLKPVIIQANTCVKPHLWYLLLDTFLDV